MIFFEPFPFCCSFIWSVMVAPQLGQKDTVSLIFFLHSGHLIKLIKQSPSVILFINNSI